MSFLGPKFPHLSMAPGASYVIGTWALIILFTKGWSEYIAVIHFQSIAPYGTLPTIYYAIWLIAIMSACLLISLLSLRGLRWIPRMQLNHEIYATVVHFSILVIWLMFTLLGNKGQDNKNLFPAESLLAATSGVLLSFNLSGATLTDEERCANFNAWFNEEMSPKDYSIMYLIWSEEEYRVIPVTSSKIIMEPLKTKDEKTGDKNTEYQFLRDGKNPIPVSECMLVKKKSESSLEIQTNLTIHLPDAANYSSPFFIKDRLVQLSDCAFGVVLDIEYHTYIVSDYNALSRPLFSLIDSKWKRQIGKSILEIDVHSSGIVDFLKGMEFRSGPLPVQYFSERPFLGMEAAIRTILSGFEIYHPEGQLELNPPSNAPMGFFDILQKFHLFLSIKLIRSMSPRNDTRYRRIIHHYGTTIVDLIHIFKESDLSSSIPWYITQGDWGDEHEMEELWKAVNKNPYDILTRFVVEPMTGPHDADSIDLKDMQAELLRLLTIRRSSYLSKAQSLADEDSGSIWFYQHREDYLTKSIASALVMELLRKLLDKNNINKNK